MIPTCVQPKVLIIDQMHDSIIPMLTNAGFIADYRPDIIADCIPDILPDYQVLVVRSKLTIGEELLGFAKNLEVIARAGAGLDNVDTQAAKKRGISVLHAAEGNRQAVAEHSIALMLNLLNYINRADGEVRNYQWRREPNRGVELRSLTVGILGYGNMGSATVDILRAFGCTILVYDKYKPIEKIEGAQRASLAEIQELADLVSIHLPLTPETYNLIDTNFLNSFTKSIYLINSARGEIITFRTIENALKNGKLIGIALDVLENEKLQHLSAVQAESFAYLITSDKVLFTPHVAGWTHQSYQRINEVLVNKLSAWYKQR